MRAAVNDPQLVFRIAQHRHIVERILRLRLKRGLHDPRSLAMTEAVA
jgi:hypothetical protein